MTFTVGSAKSDYPMGNWHKIHHNTSLARSHLGYQVSPATPPGRPSMAATRWRTVECPLSPTQPVGSRSSAWLLRLRANQTVT